jgi:hypothetical protein
MRLQFGRIRGDLVISDGQEAWVLRRTRWEQIDATMAFLKSDWLTPAQAGRAFGEDLPPLPAEAFAGREITLRAVGKGAPRITRVTS